MALISKNRTRIRSVLLVTNVVVALLPLFGLAGARFYENELIRRTEAGLTGQGVFIAETYRAALAAEVAEVHGDGADAFLRDFGRPADPRWLEDESPDDPLRPVAPQLSRVSSAILPPAPEPTAGAAADSFSVAAGHFVGPVLWSGKNVTLAGIRVLDFNGVEVAQTRGESTGQSFMAWSEVPRALEGRIITQLRERISDEPRPALSSWSRRARVRVFAAIPVIDYDRGRVYGVVVLSRTPMSLEEGLYRNRGRLFVIGGGLFLLVLALSWFTSRTIARPLQALVEQTELIKAGDPRGSQTLEHAGTYEVAQLSAALSAMARELSDREDYIRTFATSVSHEFKTPLTAMRGASELLHDHWHEMTDDERERFLEVVSGETNRLDKLVRRLLELARADVVRPGGETVDASEVMQSVVTRDARAGRVTSYEASGQCLVAVAEEVLDTVLSTLLTNAFQHGGDNVSSSVQRVGDEAIIRVSDDGAGISDSNADRVFEQFFTTDREGGGTGVGLAIVRRLCDAHGGGVELLREPQLTTFEVRLPLVTPSGNS
ncbi:MAG: signal transduction histidine kinase [Bradymonadia bacterium]|jgi:signal transduction histidine kinase